MIFAVDFDGTCVTHEYPKVGRNIGAGPVLRKLVELGHDIILFTMRSGKELEDAVNWFKEEEIPLYGVNENPTQHSWTSSPKPYAHYYIDDTAIGCPLCSTYNTEHRPFIDWFEVVEFLDKKGMLGMIYTEDWNKIVDEIEKDCEV